MMMDTRRLDSFLAVARTLHFGQAAERLHRSASGVSEDVRYLEKELGGPLFARTSRRVEITDFGRAFLHEIEPTITALNAAVAAAKRRARGQRSELKVGYLGGGFYEFTNPVIDEFRRERPDIELTFVETDYTTHLEVLRSATVDVSLIRLPTGASDLRQGSVLFQDQRLLVVPDGHRLASTSLVDPEELRHEKLLSLPADTETTLWRDYHFPTSTPKGQPIPQGKTIRTIRDGLAAVAAGEGLLTLTSRARHYYQHPGVTYVEIDLPPIQSALVARASDHRAVISDLERTCRRVMARMGVLPHHPSRSEMLEY